MTMYGWKYGERATDGSIRTLEETLSIKLPEDFIEVVRQHDGGRPWPNAVDVPGGHEEMFERLLSVSGVTGETVLEAAEVLRKQQKDKLVPFGRDAFGNLFCFEYRGPEPVGVVFWDHETGNSTRVCGSFTELLALLHEPSESPPTSNT